MFRNSSWVNRSTAAQRVIAELDAAHRDNRKLGGKAAIQREVEEGRDQFPQRQVAGGAENYEHSRIEAISGFHEASRISRLVLFVIVVSLLVRLSKMCGQAAFHRNRNVFGPWTPVSPHPKMAMPG